MSHTLSMMLRTLCTIFASSIWGEQIKAIA
jgi:hypothetical protein